MAGSVIQGYFPGGAAQTKALPPHVAARLTAPGGQPLPADVRQKMEAVFGQRFHDVRVVVGPAPQAIGAVAFTQGSQIHFAQGKYDPRTPQGQKVIAHELAHVVQQRSGRVRNPFGSGTAIVHDAQLEAEAHRLAARVTMQPAIAPPVQRNVAPPVQPARAQMRVPLPVQPARAQVRVPPPVPRTATVQRATARPHANVNARPGTVVQPVGIFATLSSIGTAALVWAGASTLATTGLGALAAYLVARQAWESYSYRTGVARTERQQEEIAAPTCFAIVNRSMRYSMRHDDYIDDHISIAVDVNGARAKTGGFWIRGGGMPEVAIGSPGVVKSDADKFEAERRAERRIKITPEQAQAIIERITHDEQHPPRFDPSGYIGYTCVTWAASVLESAGVTVSMDNMILPPHPYNVVRFTDN